MLDLPESNIFRYKLVSYKQVDELVEDVFDIKQDDVERLEQFRV